MQGVGARSSLAFEHVSAERPASALGSFPAPSDSLHFSRVNNSHLGFDYTPSKCYGPLQRRLSNDAPTADLPHLAFPAPHPIQHIHHPIVHDGRIEAQSASFVRRPQVENEGEEVEGEAVGGRRRGQRRTRQDNKNSHESHHPLDYSSNGPHSVGSSSRPSLNVVASTDGAVN